MKTRALSKLAFAIALSSGVLIQGCKKYDDDITRLEEGIDKNASDIQSLKNQLQKLASTDVVESVTSIEGGIRINFKKPDGSTYSHELSNGQDGITPLIRVGSDGTWEVAANGKDYVSTGIVAKGQDGKDGKDGAPGKDGVDGKDGKDGVDGKDGLNGKDGVDGKDGLNGGINGKDGADGKDGLDGAPGAPGKDGLDGKPGKNGKDGTVVTIKEGKDGKLYWAFDGVISNVQASFGDLAMLAVDGGYKVVFTDAAGNPSDEIFLATEAVAVSSLSLVPEFSHNNSPVVFFPRIVEKNDNARKTLLQGYASIKYNLNPYGVATENYNALGLLTQESDKVEFRSSGSTVSKSFVAAEAAAKTWGEIVVKYKPTDANTVFPRANAATNLYVALQVENNKAAENQQYAASAFNLAKEEIVEKDEVTIEKAVKDAASDEWVLRAGVHPNFNTGSDEFVEPGNASSALALAVGTATSKAEHDFVLHVVDDAQGKGGIVLNDELRSFFARTQVGDKIVSLDDHGLAGYDLRFSLANGGPTNQGNWIVIDKNNGLIQVKESTPGHTNTAAVGNTSIVRVDAYASTAANAPLIASRYINVGYTQTTAKAIAIAGQSEFTLSSAATQVQAINWPNPTQSLDNAYNLVGKSAPDFHATYNFTPAASNPAGFTFVDADNTTQATTRKVQIDQNVVNPGTYTLKGTYKSSVSTEPDVNVSIQVVVKLNGDIAFKAKEGYWEDGAVRVFGTPLNSGDWQMAGDLDEYIYLNSNIVGANVSHKFTVLPTTNNIYVTGFETTNDLSTALRAFTSANDGNLGGEYFHLINPSAPTGESFKYINGWSFVKPATKVRVDYFLNGNTKAFKSETIDVRFKNPVKTLELQQAATANVVDKKEGNNNQDVDIRQFLQLTDYRNVVIWDFDHTPAAQHKVNSEYLERYGITALAGTASTPVVNPASVQLTKAYYNDAPSTDIKGVLPQFTFAEVVADANGSAVLRWRNEGANTITKAITLEYTVTVSNTYNNGSATDSAKDIKKVVKVVVKPNN